MFEWGNGLIVCKLRVWWPADYQVSTDDLKACHTVQKCDDLQSESLALACRWQLRVPLQRIDQFTKKGSMFCEGRASAF